MEPSITGCILVVDIGSSTGGPTLSVPKFDEFARPVLQFLVDHGEEASVSSIREAAADRLGLTGAQRSEALANGRLLYQDRAAWALTWMKWPGWVVTPRRAHWAATEAGRTRLEDVSPISAAEMRSFQPPRKKKAEAPKEFGDAQTLTPQDRIDQAVGELKVSVEDELADFLRGNSPTFFEQAVLDVLKAMGYVGDLGRVEHAGQSGDGGIDGVLYLDRLGLERVHVQAKRWKGSVGQSVIRDFAGAMDVRGATKGVIVTTGTFTKAANEYVRLSPKVIRLIGGDELAELMVEFGVGVTHQRTVIIPRLDLDYFEG